MEKVKKAWRRGFIDDNPKTAEEEIEILRSYLEYAKERDEKEAREKDKR